MVISGGVNLYPAEIEAVLINAPQITDCAVFGIPDEDLGEVLLAAVELAPGGTMTADEVKNFLIERISITKVPRHIKFYDKMPREESGKLLKRKLRDPFWEKSGRNI